jgi:plastocyanin
MTGALALCLIGCGSSPVAVDASSADAGARDAAAEDAIAAEDSGLDGGRDAALVDAGAPDVGTDTGPDAAIAPDASTVCAADHAGCATFDDLRGTSSISIRIVGDEYSPRCVRVSAGTTVEIAADFSHRLSQACGERLAFEDIAFSNVSVVVSTPGVYGIYCIDHGDAAGNGMAGAILVDP